MNNRKHLIAHEPTHMCRLHVSSSSGIQASTALVAKVLRRGSGGLGTDVLGYAQTHLIAVSSLGTKQSSLQNNFLRSRKIQDCANLVAIHTGSSQEVAAALTRLKTRVNSTPLPNVHFELIAKLLTSSEHRISM